VIGALGRDEEDLAAAPRELDILSADDADRRSLSSDSSELASSSNLRLRLLRLELGPEASFARRLVDVFLFLTPDRMARRCIKVSAKIGRKTNSPVPLNDVVRVSHGHLQKNARSNHD
jgi:hypothetical protein